MSRLFGKKRKKRIDGTEEVSLNITAMADVFTVLLVFLLKSFATGSINLTPTAGLLLPEAQAKAPDFEALKIEIAENSIVIEGKPRVTLKQFSFGGGELLSNGSSKSLNHALQTERKRQIAIAKQNKSVKIDAKILIVADQRTPYSTIKNVLASAAVNGYTDFKLAVVNKE